MARLFDDAQSEYLQVESPVVTAYPFAMACKFRSNDLVNNQALMWVGDKDENLYFSALLLYGGSAGDPLAAFTHQYSAGAPGRADTSTGYSANTWHHAAGIFLSTAERHAYIDGGSKGSDTVNVGAISGHDRTAIGGLRDNTPGAYMSGDIAEAAIWDLTDWGETDAERETAFETVISALANDESPSNYPLGLIAYWPLRDDDDDEADSFDLTAYNTPSWSTHPDVIYNILGSVSAQSNLSADIKIIKDLTGSSESSSGVSGSLNVSTDLSGSLASNSGASGSLSVPINLTGSSESSSGASGSLSGAGTLSGISFSNSSAFGSLNVSINLTGSFESSSGASGSLSGVGTLSGISFSNSSASGSLNVSINLTGSFESSSGTSGSLSVGLIEISGSILSSSNLSAELITYFDSRYRINSLSNISGFLDVVPDFEAATLFWRPQNNIVETLEWKTAILKADDGTEQRIKIRQSPRQHFKYEVLLETDKLNAWIDSQIHGWQKFKWLIPVWTESVEHSADINHHDGTITVDTTNADFRNGSKAMIWKSRTEYEVIVIDTVEDNQLNLSYTILNNFTGAKYILPVREAYMTASSNKQRFNSQVSRIDLVFKIHDNTNIIGFVPIANYDGFPVLNIPSFMNQTHGESSNPDIMVLDYSTGTFKIINHTNFNFVIQQHKFINEGKAACWNFKKLLYSLNGKQKTVLIPTFRSDLTLTSSVSGTNTAIDIENINLAKNMGLNNLRTYLGFYFPAIDQLIIRKMTAIAEVDSSTERITLDAALQNSIIATNSSCRIGFVDKCRLNSDSIELRWGRAHENECETKFVRIP